MGDIFSEDQHGYELFIVFVKCIAIFSASKETGLEIRNENDIKNW